MLTFWERAACNFIYFPVLGFEGRIWVLFPPVPGHCLHVTSAFI